MKYIRSNFHVEDVNLQKLAKKFDTPLYCYSYEKLKKNIKTETFNFDLSSSTSSFW